MILKILLKKLNLFKVSTQDKGTNILQFTNKVTAF